MGITTALCNSFKQELLQGTHQIGTHTLKMALIKSGESGTYGAATTNYSNVTGNSDEISNTGNYSAGGGTLANVSVTLDGTRAYVDFDDVQFTSATIDANGALIYNSSASNKAIAVISFGTTQSSDSGSFTVQIPAVGSGGATAIIRVE